jgi:hypothetical protein
MSDVRSVICRPAVSAACALAAALIVPAALAHEPPAAAGAEAAQPAGPGGVDAKRVFKDPVTGQLRAPQAGEAEDAAQKAARTAPAAAKRASAMQTHPMVQRLTNASAPSARFGAAAQRLDMSDMSFTVVRRSADGSVSSQCVTGPAAAKAAIDGRVAKGNHHDH